MWIGIKNWKAFCARWLHSPGWTPRRVVIAIVFFLVFPLLEAAVWFGLLLDHLFFRGYQRETVACPVFIIGNPRSGTTFLHRLISKDDERFTTMRMWEVLFAPSIVQRNFFYALSAAIRRFSTPLGERLAGLERCWYRAHGMHEISFTQPEEDDYLMLHIWSALSTGLSAGLIRQALPYTYFDSDISQPERKRVMAFYKACIQRHLHARRLRRRADPGTYLAKNPAACPKVRSILEAFPDARFIYIVRDPCEMVPSYISMMTYSWQVLGTRHSKQQLRDYITEMARHWYTYPIEQLHAAGADHVVVYYQDLVRHPQKTVRYIYQRLQWPIGPDFENVLAEESQRARKHKSRHRYNLAGAGLSRGDIRRDFKKVFELFEFEKERKAS
jgi:hypothetical protein